MIIYKHTSKTTGKSYIGQTKYSVQHRLNGHVKEANRGSNCKFHNAIREIGVDDFITEIIEECKDDNTLKEREIFWIEYFDTYRSGYNGTPGGEGGTWTKESHTKGVETRKQNGSYISGAKRRKETIINSGGFAEILQRTADTKRQNGDYKRLSEFVKENGIGYDHLCEHCGKTVKGANYNRWHGDNCKQNPNISKEQLDLRIPWNKDKRKE